MTLLPGDYLVTPTHGNWRTRIAAFLIRYGTESPVNHSALYVGEVAGYDKPQIIEARPGGAGYADWDSYSDCTWSTSRLPLDLVPTDEQRILIAQAATGMVGTPYGWLDLVAIALAQRRLGRVVDGDEWWVRRIASSRTLICSQLVDRAYLEAGVHLFDDGRIPGLVSPGDLSRLLT